MKGEGRGQRFEETAILSLLKIGMGTVEGKGFVGTVCVFFWCFLPKCYTFVSKYSVLRGGKKTC